MKGESLKKYIIIYHDDRDLYEDVVLRVFDEADDGCALNYYKNNANKIVANTFRFDNDGRWRMTKALNYELIPAQHYLLCKDNRGTISNS